MQNNMDNGRDNSAITLMFEKHGDVFLIFFSF